MRKEKVKRTAWLAQEGYGGHAGWGLAAAAVAAASRGAVQSDATARMRAGSGAVVLAQWQADALPSRHIPDG